MQTGKKKFLLCLGPEREWQSEGEDTDKLSKAGINRQVKEG